MNQSLLISEILFAIIYLIAGFVTYELIKSKDGELRKIMIAYFSSVIFTYLLSAIYFIQPQMMTVSLYHIIVNTPKAVVMLWLYSFLRRQKN